MMVVKGIFCLHTLNYEVAQSVLEGGSFQLKQLIWSYFPSKSITIILQHAYYSVHIFIKFNIGLNHNVNKSNHDHTDLRQIATRLSKVKTPSARPSFVVCNWTREIFYGSNSPLPRRPRSSGGRIQIPPGAEPETGLPVLIPSLSAMSVHARNAEINVFHYFCRPISTKSINENRQDTK